MTSRRRSLSGNLALRSRWLAIGLGVKRWLVILGLGVLIAGLGAVYLLVELHSRGWLSQSLYELLTLQSLPSFWRITLPLVIGAALILLAVVRLGANLVQPFRRADEDVGESLYHYSKRSRGPRVAAVGGGTGLPTLLRGLKEYTTNITAIVTVADDGGSSGRLRRDMGLLPPGDFRNNMAALARDEGLLTQLFQYRFGASQSAQPNGGAELQGHAFGNLLLAALVGITGSFDEALLAAARVLAIRGRVLPSTLEQVTLVADVQVPVEAGVVAVERVAGESNIPKRRGRVERVYLEPTAPQAYPPAIQTILQADLVVLGPGSLYTSIIPNLLVPQVADALRTTRAQVVYVCNLATQPGETDGYDIGAHVKALEAHCPGCIDLVVGNSNLAVPAETGGGHTVFVQPTCATSGKKGWRLLLADLVDEMRPWRHDSRKLAEVIVDILDGNLTVYVASEP